MPINLLRKAVFISLLALFTATASNAQVVWENSGFEIYDFLARQAQKGNIEFTDFIQPVSRKEIAAHLSTLSDSTSRLSAKERKELNFYMQEYSEFAMQDTGTFYFAKKDSAGRLRFLSSEKGGFVVRGEPVITLESILGGGQEIFKKGNGAQLWGHINKNLSFQFYFKDVTESGKGLDSLKDFTPEQGIVRTKTVNLKTVSYSDIRGNITYNFGDASVSLGKDNLLWGFGRNGRIILSDKAPSYPLIRFDYKPAKWVSFQYAHAWLQSAIIDSNRTYSTGNTVYGGKREFYIPKFMATHSLNFFPVKGLALSLGESIIYSDKLNVAYLIPVMFFKAYDHYTSRHNITSGSNGQFYLQASSRNHIRNTHLYASVFIDEIRTSALFDRSKSRNQVGFTLGTSITDLLPYLTLGVEYSRINPFVYENLIPAQSYRNQNYSLGDWMGNNADRLTGYIEYTPVARLKAMLRWQNVRKGASGTIEQQYYQEPQPQFLFGLTRQQSETEFGLSYQIIHNIYAQSRLRVIRDEFVLSNTTRKTNIFRFGLSIGM